MDELSETVVSGQPVFQLDRYLSGMREDISNRNFSGSIHIRIDAYTCTCSVGRVIYKSAAAEMTAFGFHESVFGINTIQIHVAIAIA